jgi:hypothetical protein
VQYTISYDISSFAMTAGAIQLLIGSSQGASDLLAQNITANGSFSHNFTASTAVTWVKFYATNVTNGQFDLDNVSIPGTVPVVIKEGGFAQLISGSADNWEVVRAWLYDLGFIRDPYRTPILSDLEKEYGIFTDTNLAEAERRDKLAAVKYARAGTGTIDDLQTALDRAFPDAGFVVYNNCPVQDPGGVVSDNLVLDGDMEQTAATPPWIVGNSATLTKDVADPKTGLRNLRIARNAVNNPYAEQVGIMDVGKEYRFRGWAKSDGNAYPTLSVAGQLVWQGTLSTDWQYFDVTDVTISSGTLQLISTTSTGTEYTEWDEISITETGVLIVNGQIFNLYTDYIAGAGELAALCGQPTSNPGDPGPLAGDNYGIAKNQLEYTIPTDSKSWPLIFFVGGQARYYSLLVDGDMDRSDVAAWSVGNAATLTKPSTSPKNGPYNLRVTSTLTWGDARQTILTIGNSYRAIGWMRSDGTTEARVLEQNTILDSTLSTSWTKFDVTFTATGTLFRLVGSGATWAEFDDVQVIPQGTSINQMEAGEALSQCGEPLAYAGAYAGEIISIDRISVSEDRQPDLERLILGIKPMHSWCLLFVDYT